MLGCSIGFLVAFIEFNMPCPKSRSRKKRKRGGPMTITTRIRKRTKKILSKVPSGAVLG